MDQAWGKVKTKSPEMNNYKFTQENINSQNADCVVYPQHSSPEKMNSYNSLQEEVRSFSKD